MLEESGRYAVTFNGEIYNFRELRARLEQAGHRFRTQCDTEVLLVAYREYGDDVFDMLDGMFALAIYDRMERCLVLARDRAGEKPLYYMHTQDRVIFASELSAIVDAVPGRLELSEPAVASYFLLRYVPAPLSIIDGIRKLEPGTILRIRANGDAERKRYYAFELDPSFDHSETALSKMCDAVEEHLIRSLERRLNSDVPLGVFLSAGVDSTLATAILTRKLGRPVKSFSIGFEDDAKSEHLDARRFADIFATDHHEHVFSMSDFERVGRSIGAEMDEPNGDRSCVPTYLLSQFAREHVTVAISGDGGDELFCGYNRFLAFANHFGGSPPQDADQALELYFRHFLSVFPDHAVREAMPDGHASHVHQMDRFTPFFRHPERSPVLSLRQLDFATYLPGAVLPKVDRMSMRHGLEVRSPFFEPGLLAIASTLPAAFCRQDSISKVILRLLLARYAPMELVMLPKRGFGMPPSVFEKNGTALQADLNAAYEALRGTSFFQQRTESLNQLRTAATANVNAVWAFIVIGQWCNARTGRF